jgi:hypothetical protein
MVRPVYDWNRNFGRPGNSTAQRATFKQLFQFTGKANPKFLFGGTALPKNWIAEWNRMIDKDGLLPDRFARRIDTNVASPLFDLINEGTDPAIPAGINTMLKRLAVRNLLRGYLLSLPTGQAVATALGIAPLTAADLQQNASAETVAALTLGGFIDKTPLWYYILKEAETESGGNSLGSVGSEVVVQTIIGQIKNDQSSYLSQTSWSPAEGVRLQNGSPVKSIPDFLRFAGVLAL